MARQLRIKFPGAWYHIMNRGINKNKIFFNSAHKNTFLNCMEKTVTIYGVEIHAYCLMDNHYHLIVHTPRANISEAMRYLNSIYARYLNTNLNRDGSVFRGRFKAKLISADDYLLTLSKYIHNNPKEAGIIENLSEFKWSSYRAYIGISSVPDWLNTHEIISRFGSNDFINKYKIFMAETPSNFENEYGSSNNSPVLGDIDFKEMIDNYVKLHSLSSEISGADKIITPPQIETIIYAVATHFNISADEVCKTKNGTFNKARRIAIYICRELGGHTLKDIGRIMGGISYKTVSSTIYRVKSNINELNEAQIIIKKLQFFQ